MTATLTATDRTVFTLLRKWINQRPNLEFANYGSVSGYRADQRRIAQQKADALALLAYAENTSYDVAAQLPDAFRHAFSGRLSYDAETQTLDYTCGQYWPTEYRAAACAVLAQAIWTAWREDAKGNPTFALLEMRARRTFPRGIVARWFR